MIAPGTIIGHHYRIQELIGSGGMAEVYLAISLSSRRPVAIKVLKEEFRNDAEFLRRFEREAKAVLHLSHDNIVRAYGVGETGGLPYIVLEYVEGRTLKQLVTENGPMPQRLAVSIMLQILSALDAAHRSGIIHRDVKPQNVIIMKDGTAKLADFGIARDANAGTMTFAGPTVLGSVHYISPEQAQGKTVTESSDLYSAAVMLYEMVTGTVPFSADSSVPVALMHINDKPVPPMHLNPQLAPAFNDVILCAMRKNPLERYGRASEMMQDLKRALKEPNGTFAGEYSRPSAAEPVKASPSGRKPRVHGAVKIGVVVLAIVSVIIGLFLILNDAYQTSMQSVDVVPLLTDRTVEEARQKAEDYGFVFEIREYEESETVPYGAVMTQTPDAGVNARLGTVIYATVSLGRDNPTVPDLSGLTLDEARESLRANGFTLGKVTYEVSDIAIGYVCNQSILGTTEAARGTVIDVSISASSESAFTMPSVVNEVLNVALGILGENNLSAIFVRYDSTSLEEDGVVIQQSPEADDPAVSTTAVYLTVSGSQSTLPFAADVAFNRTIEAADTHVMAVMRETFNGIAYQRILYENTLPKGDNTPISFTAYSNAEGSYEIILYVSGTEVKRQDVSFLPKVA